MPSRVFDRPGSFDASLGYLATPLGIHLPLSPYHCIYAPVRHLCGHTGLERYRCLYIGLEAQGTLIGCAFAFKRPRPANPEPLSHAVGPLKPDPALHPKWHLLCQRPRCSPRSVHIPLPLFLLSHFPETLFHIPEGHVGVLRRHAASRRTIES